MGWFPDDYNLFFSHSSDITRMYYDGVLTMLTNGLDYTWHEIFPHLAVTSTNAKMMQINIGKYKPFQNLMTASVGSEMSGKVRASKFLFVDDMIGKIEEALNKNTLDKLWNIYTTDARQRKVEGCKELIIATRWSVNDVIGRLQRSYANSNRCEFIAVADIDETTGESNFNFEFNGCTRSFQREERRKALNELTTLGLTPNTSYFASVYGIKPQTFERMLEEAHYGDLTSKLTMLMNKNTMSGVTDNGSGRPTADYSDMTDNGATAREYQ
jgi:hypothetical protein